MGLSVTIPAGGSTIEPGLTPAKPVTLTWRTFSEAADEAGRSRRLAGIHFESGDLAARVLGRRVGSLALNKSRQYFGGTARAW
jgi:hypothetical protein